MRPKSKWLMMPSVRVFDEVRLDKQQAIKPLEEAAELFGAWQAVEHAETAIANEWPREQQDVKNAHRHALAMARNELLAECADTIQAVANVAASLGVTDFTAFMSECEKRNRDRGRITK